MTMTISVNIVISQLQCVTQLFSMATRQQYQLGRRCMQDINFFHLIGLKQSALDNEIDNRLSNINFALDQASSQEEMMQYTDYNIIKGILTDRKKKSKYLKAIKKWNIAPTVVHWTVKYYIVFKHILIIYII